MSDEYDVYNLDDAPVDLLKLLLHGDQGAGKTALGASIAKKVNLVIVDLPGEKGLRTIKKVPYSNNIKVIRPKEVGQLDDIYWDLQTDSGDVKGSDAVMLESTSAYYKMVLRMLMGNPENRVRTIDKKVRMPDQQMYGKALEFMTDLSTFWYGLADSTVPYPKHVIMTSQSKYVEDEETGEAEVTLDVSSGSRGPLLAAPDFVGYCFVERGETEVLTEEKWDFKVRFGPHDTIKTKIHESIEKSKKLPPVFHAGQNKGKPITIPLLCKIWDIPL